MNEKEQLERIKKNALSLSLSMSDAPFRGANQDQIDGVNHAIKVIFENTEITTESLIREAKKEDWFKPYKEGEVR